MDDGVIGAKECGTEAVGEYLFQGTIETAGKAEILLDPVVPAGGIGLLKLNECFRFGTVIVTVDLMWRVTGIQYGLKAAGG